MTPVYPYLVAGVFKLFGTYTKASAIMLLSLNALMSALACVLVFLIGRVSFGDRVAKWSGWVWAFCPYAIYFPVERIWETWRPGRQGRELCQDKEQRENPAEDVRE